MKRVMTALDTVDAWAEAERSQLAEDQAEVAEQLGQVRAALARLDGQRQGLEEAKATLEARVAGLRVERLHRAHRALFGVLGEQARDLEARQQELATPVAAQVAGLFAALEGTAMAPLLEEYDQFVDTVQPNLITLPDSYRTAVVQHHDRISARLADHLRTLAAAPVSVAVAPLQAEVVYAVDAPEGPPELLVVVLPVSDQVVLRWHEQTDGLPIWLAARVVQALYESAHAVGFTAAQATCGGHQGLMAVEVELYDAPEGYVEAFEQRLGAILATSDELLASRVTLTPRRVDADVVFPPEETAGSPPRPVDEDDEPMTETDEGGPDLIEPGGLHAR